MNDRQSSTIRPHWAAITVAAVTAALAVVMQCAQAYRFYAKEAEHLWLSDALWIGQWLRQPGGVVQLMTSGVTQFFGLWGMGSLTMAVVMGLLLCCALGWQRRLRLPAWAAAWWLLPLTFLVLCHENGYYSLRGTVALLPALVGVWLYARCPRAWLAVLLVLAVYGLAGSTGLLLAALISVTALLMRRGWLAAVLAVLTALLAAGVGVQQGVWTTMEEALTPAQYYEWPSTYFVPLYAWAGFALVPLLAALLGPRWPRTLVATGVAVAVVTGMALYGAVHNPKIYLLRQDEWRAARQDWDGIIAAHEGSDAPTPFISYLNLALAERGELVRRMGEFKPYIAWSDEAQMYSPVLMTQNELSRDAQKLQSAVCWAWGGAALCNAQKAAFEANFLTPGMTDPVELRRLALTNSLLETPVVAQKYLRRLSRTTMHHAWADSMLHNPARLAAEVNCLPPLPADDAFYLKTQVVRTLRQIVMQPGHSQVAEQFYEAYLVQSRDSVGYRRWKEGAVTDAINETSGANEADAASSIKPVIEQIEP